MKPSQLARSLKRIASGIEASKKPKKELVIRDLKKIIAVVHTAQNLKEWTVQYSLHGMVTVNVPVDPSWLDADEDLLPQYKNQVKESGIEIANSFFEDLPKDVKWQLEEM